MLLTNDIFILKVGSCRHVRSNVHKQDVFCPFCCTSWKLSSKRSHLSKIHETSRPGWKLKFADLWRLLCFILLTFPFCALRLHGWLACITIDSRYLSLNNLWINVLHLKFESAAASQFPLETPEQFLSSLCSLLQLHTCFHFPHLPGLPTHLLSCTSFHHQPLSI